MLIEEIAEIFYASHRVFGSRKITSIMRSRGRLINLFIIATIFLQMTKDTK